MKKISLTLSVLAAIAVSGLAQDANRTVVSGISSAENTEFSPTISANGRVMIFESDVDKKKGWELFESRLDSVGVWSQPIPLKAINEKCNFLAGPSLSYDGNTLYYTAFIEGVTQSEDIFYSERIDETNWSEPKSVGAPINTDDGYEGFPSISADGNTLYFIRVNEDNTYDKKAKENCFSIFAAQRGKDGTWAEPVALPAPINTGCERDPKIMADNHTLIFSSIRPGGKGKYDLYQTRLQPGGTWAEPVALDFINATDNDQSPCISAAGDVMFFYSQKDIYSVAIPMQYRQMINVTVQGYVRSERTNEGIAALLTVREVGSNNSFTHESNSTDGLYSLVLAAGKKYQVTISHPTHLTQMIEFDFEKQDRYLEVKRDILLTSSYYLSLSVVDRDLKQKLSAKVTARGAALLYDDTLRIESSPLRLKLEAGKNYELEGASDRYPKISHHWVFDATTCVAEMNYQLELIHEKVRYVAEVTNVVSNQKTKLKVYFNNETVDEVLVADAGDGILLRKGDRYQVMTSSDKGYFYTSTSLIAGEGQPDSNGGYSLALAVIPIEVGGLLPLDYITFGSNSADLNETSFVELDRVIELLGKNPTLHVEIAAHTDNVGNDDFNLKLSEKRANSVVDYLTRKGAELQRLKPIGYGKSQPLMANDTEANRAKNRRVELRVLKVD